MASPAAPARSFKKAMKQVLDPTKMGTWNVVRLPPIEKNAIIQGKPREQNSNAFKTHQWKEGVRLRKALNALTHGKNIFVYHNIRTNQVVYSLTRYLEKNSVLRQLVYHGKKTVPATLRKDMWVPYYSVHFNDSQVGLRAYHLLREFSLQRQLEPPREMITITEKYLDQKRPRHPEQAKKFDEEYADKLGWLMKKKDRARAVMDQKATSVADISAVLAIQEEEIANGFGEYSRGYLTKTARRRRREARKRAEKTAAQQAERIEQFKQTLSTKKVTFEIAEIKDAAQTESKDTVKILWNDLHNARFAESWPLRVLHGELSLSRDHVMPGQKQLANVGILADKTSPEKEVTA
ncbi:transcriptional regulation of mitochondrial recombination-domain-containing protein [Aspergillus karnatakaensis]|uniref:mitochondrial 54S ribosomal protein mL67 n=1 Tax=Aspergillus karnatakaensis TaxID=1810916 RepID=UPI003CCCE695